MASPNLSPTSRVILGMIALGKSSGYDIKRLVDDATSNFWPASYGQIYPDLRRLEDAGLIRGESEPTGGRARTVYELTEAGNAALRQWLQSDLERMFEVRDEALLRLFFSDFGPPEQRLEVVRAMRNWHQRVLDQLRKLDPRAAGPQLTWEFGTGLHQWIVQWCEATERRLAAETDKE
jgi:DNA-binding PadR family transcriptional regulator